MWISAVPSIQFVASYSAHNQSGDVYNTIFLPFSFVQMWNLCGIPPEKNVDFNLLLLSWKIFYVLTRQSHLIPADPGNASFRKGFYPTFIQPQQTAKSWLLHKYMLVLVYAIYSLRFNNTSNWMVATQIFLTCSPPQGEENKTQPPTSRLSEIPLISAWSPQVAGGIWCNASKLPPTLPPSGSHRGRQRGLPLSQRKPRRK